MWDQVDIDCRATAAAGNCEAARVKTLRIELSILMLKWLWQEARGWFLLMLGINYNSEAHLARSRKRQEGTST
jgi:hypothetical protein